jgi:putative NADPH-quinone reductase
MPTVTLLTAHPEPTSFNLALAAAYRAGAERAGAHVEAFDVTRLAFDPVLRHGYAEPQADEPDLARVRAAIDVSAHVAWFFPTWWAGLPAVLKGLVDRLMLPGKAFVYEGGPLPRGLMAGRSSRYVTTMDSPAPWYWLAHHDALGGSFGRGTLRYVGFAPVTRTMVYRVRKLSQARRAKWLVQLQAQGERDVRALPKTAPVSAGAAPTA